MDLRTNILERSACDVQSPSWLVVVQLFVGVRIYVFSYACMCVAGMDLYHKYNSGKIKSPSKETTSFDQHDSLRNGKYHKL